MARSIRWSFAFWQSTILVLVVVGLSALFLRELRVTVFEEVDSELRGVAVGLVSSSRPPPERRRPPRPPRPPREEPPWRTRLPAPLETYFDGTQDGAPYFVVWSPSGRVIESSLAENAKVPSAAVPRGEVGSRQRGDAREVFLRLGPRGGIVLVGRSIRAELSRLGRIQNLVLLGAFGALGIGLVCGWLVARRAVRPIEGMSRAAEAISVNDLSQRLDASAGPAELERLAQVLNGAFDRLQDAYERQKRLVADASHELRTPVAVILTQAQHALSRERESGRYRAALESCERSADRMRRLVEQLLTLSAMDESSVELQRERFDLSVAVREVATALAPLAEERGTTISLELEATEVEGDADRLSEVVTNLLSNALRYPPPGGRVTLRLRPEGPSCVLEVEDEGEGVPAEHRGRIFERFYRVDPSRSRAAGGSGLGLSITRELVEAHGGRIDCEDGAGGGALFRVVLPLRAEAT